MDNNIKYINQQLFMLDNNNNNNLEELPYQYDPTQYMFEIQFKVYTPKDMEIINSTISLSPQMVLIGYIQGKQKAGIMFNEIRRFLNIESIDTTAAILADMVTPNLQPNIWIRDLEHVGYLITPLFLTVSDMRKLVFYDNIENDPQKFTEAVLKNPEIFYFIPYLDTTRIDTDKVYVTHHIKKCSTKIDNKDNVDGLNNLDIR